MLSQRSQLQAHILQDSIHIKKLEQKKIYTERLVIVWK